MSYLTPYLPQDAKTFLEAHPALAEFLGEIGLIALSYLAVGLLILWRVKFYRPKPIRPKEPKTEGSTFLGNLGFRVFKFVYFTYTVLGSLVFVLIILAVLGGLLYSLFTGQINWGEQAFVFGLFFFSVFCIWLIGR